MTIPDPRLLAHGAPVRVGDDLVIVGADGERFVVDNYFLMDPPPALVAGLQRQPAQWAQLADIASDAFDPLMEQLAAAEPKSKAGSKAVQDFTTAISQGRDLATAVDELSAAEIRSAVARGVPLEVAKKAASAFANELFANLSNRMGVEAAITDAERFFSGAVKTQAIVDKADPLLTALTTGQDIDGALRGAGLNGGRGAEALGTALGSGERQGSAIGKGQAADQAHAKAAKSTNPLMDALVSGQGLDKVADQLADPNLANRFAEALQQGLSPEQALAAAKQAAGTAAKAQGAAEAQSNGGMEAMASGKGSEQQLAQAMKAAGIEGQPASSKGGANAAGGGGIMEALASGQGVAQVMGGGGQSFDQAFGNALAEGGSIAQAQGAGAKAVTASGKTTADSTLAQIASGNVGAVSGNSTFENAVGEALSQGKAPAQAIGEAGTRASVALQAAARVETGTAGGPSGGGTFSPAPSPFVSAPISISPPSSLPGTGTATTTAQSGPTSFVAQVSQTLQAATSQTISNALSSLQTSLANSTPASSTTTTKSPVTVQNPEVPPPPNVAPTLTVSGTSPFSVAEDGTITVNFAASDVDGIITSVRAASDNAALLPQNALTLGGSGGARTLTIAPTANLFGSGNVVLTATDNAGATATSSIALTVNPVADTAVVAAAATNEDTATTLTLSRNAVDGAEIQFFQISGLTGGTLATLGGGAITNGDMVAIAADGTAQVRFTPSLNLNTADAHAFSFGVRGAVAADGSGLSPVTATQTITVAAINDAPTAANATLAFNEDTARVLTAADFGFADVDTGAAMSKVQIQSFTSAGALEFFNGTDWVAATAGQDVTKAELDAGKLRVTPVAHANGDGYATLSFKVHDGLLPSAAANTLTFNVTPVNDAPTITASAATLTRGAVISLNTFLESADVDVNDTPARSLPAELTYTITAAPSDGALFRSTTQLAANATFTQADIDAGLVTYQHFGHAGVENDSFTYSLSDGAGGALTGQMALTVNASAAPVNLFAYNQSGFSGRTSASYLVDPANVNTTTTGSFTFQGISAPVASAKVRVGAHDVDSLIGEWDKISLNGNELGRLSGWSGQDSETSFKVNSLSWLASGTNTNTVSVQVTSFGGGSWLGTNYLGFNVRLDWARLDITTTAVTGAQISAYDLVGKTVSGSNASVDSRTVVTVDTTGDYRLDYRVLTAAGQVIANESVSFHGNAGEKVVVNASPSYALSQATGTYQQEVSLVRVGGSGQSIKYKSFSHTQDSGPTISHALATLPASTQDGTVVALLGHSEADLNQTVTYSLLANGDNLFRLGTNALGVPALLVNGNDLSQSANTAHVVQVKATDSTGLSYVESFTVNIGAANAAPVFQASGIETAQATNEDTALTFTALATDANGNAVTYSAVADNGTIAVAGGQITYTPAADWSGSDTVTITASDGLIGGTATKTVTVNVAAVNDAPVVASDASLSSIDIANAGTSLVTLLNGIATDVEGDAIGIAVTALGSNNGTWQYDAGIGWTNFGSPSSGAPLMLGAAAKVRFAPAGNWDGTATFTFRGWDGTAISTVDRTATLKDLAPTVTSGTPAVTYVENAAALIVAAALTVADNDTTNLNGATISISSNFTAGDVLAVTAALPATVTSSYNAATGVLSLSGQATQAQYQTLLQSVTYSTPSDAPSTATRTISFTVTDGFLTSSAGTATVNVTAVNDAPTITGASPDGNAPATAIATNANTAYSGRLAGSDPEGNAFTYAVSAGSTHAKGTLTVNADGTFTYTPNANATGADSFTAQATDSLGASSTRAIAVTIQDPPVVLGARDGGGAIQVAAGEYALASMGTGTATNQLTLEATVMLTSTATKHNLLWWGDGTVNTGATSKRYSLELNTLGNGQKVLSLWTDNGRIDANFDFAPDTWYNLAATFDGTKVDLYANGALLSSTTTALGGFVLRNQAQHVGIGADINPTAFPSTAIIDEVKVWNVARSATDIATSHNKVLTGTETGLQGYWNFDGLSSTVADLSGHNSRSAVFASGASAPTALDVPDRAVRFDGTNDYVSLGTPAALATGTGDYTQEAWIRTSRTGVRQEILRYGGSEGATNQGAFFYVDATGYLRSDTSNQAAAVSARTVNDGLWHHVAAVHRNGTIQLYIDGAADGAAAAATPNIQTGTALIGASTAMGTYFRGDIADVRVWNTVRSAAEIAGDRNDQLTGSEEGLVGYWRLDEGTGTTVANSVAGGGGGTLTNGAAWATTGAPIYDTAIATDANTVLRGDLKAGDADGSAMTYSLASGPTLGSLEVNNDGTYTYTPYRNRTGSDSFTVTASDGTLSTSRAVTVTINDPVTAASTQTQANTYAELSGGKYLSGTSTLSLGGTITYEAWINTSTRGDWLGIVGTPWNNSGDYDSLQFTLNADGKLWLEAWEDASNRATYVGTTDVADGLWHHVAATWNSATSSAAIYVDGVADNASVVAGAVGTTSGVAIGNNTLAVGANSTLGYIYTGAIDEVRVWNTARTAAELKADMYRTLEGTEANLVQYFDFEEGSGTSATNKTGTSTLTAQGAGTLAWGQTTRKGGAIRLGAGDNTAGSITLTNNNDSLDVGASGTIEMWVKRGVWDTTSTNDSLINAGLGNTANNALYLSAHPNVGLHFRQGGGSETYVSTLDSNSWTADSWHHVAATWNNGVLALYADGQLKATRDVGVTVANPDPTWSLGAAVAGSDVTAAFGQSVDDVRIWSTARSLSEIQSDMNNVAAGNEIGLQGYWKLDDGSGTTIANSVVGGGAGTLSNGTWANAAPIDAPANGNAGLKLDGTDDYASVAGIGLANQSFSWEAWAYRDAANNDFIFGQGVGVDNQGLIIGYYDTGFQFSFHGAQSLTSADTTVNQWVHWAGTYDAVSNQRILYRNGAEVTRDTTAADYQGSGTFYIGDTSWSGGKFGGTLDEARLWSDVRTASEIRENYTKHLTGAEDNLTALWHFDEGLGTTASDATAANRDVTLTNGATWDDLLTESATNNVLAQFHTQGTESDGGALAFTLIGGNGGASLGTASIDANSGVISYTAGAVDGSDQISYQITDAGGATSVGIVQVTVV